MVDIPSKRAKSTKFLPEIKTLKIDQISQLFLYILTLVYFYIFLLLEKSRKSRKSRGKNPAGIGTEEIPNPAGRDSGFYTSTLDEPMR